MCVRMCLSSSEGTGNSLPHVVQVSGSMAGAGEVAGGGDTPGEEGVQEGGEGRVSYIQVFLIMILSSVCLFLYFSFWMNEMMQCRRVMIR